MEKRKKSTRKHTVSATIKKAERLLKEQKEDFKRIFKAELKRKAGGSKNAAVRAGEVYRKKYGATRKSRWKNALKEAKERLF